MSKWKERSLGALIASCLLAPTSFADGEKPGSFDYYVLALSWSPTWCALEGDARDAGQCAPEADYGWIMHGLWPQYHRGWPAHCPTIERPPSRAMTRDMVDVMGSAGLAWYQWKKHGSCTGLPAAQYYALSRNAYDSITKPQVFRALQNPVKLLAKVVEEAFLKENPQLEPDMITITCRQNRIQEARICLSKTLDPVPCGRDVIKDCALEDALFDPIR